MFNFKKLEIWKRWEDLVTEIYLLTQAYPREEIFGLTAQPCRVAASVRVNISEGLAKSNNKYFCHFLEMVVGSSFELETALSQPAI